MHCARHFRDEFRRLSDRHRRVPDYFIKLTAFDKLHAEVARAITLTDLMDRNYAGMLQASCRFGFETEAFQMRFARPLTKANDL